MSFMIKIKIRLTTKKNMLQYMYYIYQYFKHVKMGFSMKIRSNNFFLKESETSDISLSFCIISMMTFIGLLRIAKTY